MSIVRTAPRTTRAPKLPAACECGCYGYAVQTPAGWLCGDCKGLLPAGHPMAVPQ